MDGVTVITVVSVALPVVFFVFGGMQRLREAKEKGEQGNEYEIPDDLEQGIVEGSVMYLEEEEEQAYG